MHYAWLLGHKNKMQSVGSNRPTNKSSRYQPTHNQPQPNLFNFYISKRKIAKQRTWKRNKYKKLSSIQTCQQSQLTPPNITNQTTIPPPYLHTLSLSLSLSHETMRESMERFSILPFSIGCVSHSSIDVIESHPKKSQRETNSPPPCNLHSYYWSVLLFSFSLVLNVLNFKMSIVSER